MTDASPHGLERFIIGSSQIVSDTIVTDTTDMKWIEVHDANWIDEGGKPVSYVPDYVARL